MKEAIPVAVEALSWLEMRNLSEKLALQRTVRQLKVVDAVVVDHAYSLIVEVTRRRNTLDYIIGLVLEGVELGDLKLGVRNLLRLYTYELKYGSGSITRALDISDTGRELLGRRAVRPVEEALSLIPYTDIDYTGLPEVERESLETSHPVWFVEYLRNLLGEEAGDFLAVSSLPDYVRVNGLKNGEFDPEGCRYMGLDELPGVFQVEACETPLNIQEGYRKGLFTIQDKASILAGLIAAPEPGMTVLDVCAAPGGKTSHIADLMGNRGRIVSVDYDERRLDTWRHETERMGVEIAMPVLGDATKRGGLPTVSADLVLVDPPCTGTGTFVRSPSGKWRLTERSIDRMSEIQAKILENSSRHVRPGGRLVYCTCSVTLEENELVVKRFLEGHPEFRLTKAPWGVGRPGFLGQEYALRLYPHIDLCNGFYIALLTREMYTPDKGYMIFSL